ncbi:MAG: hypothetical protein JXQ73_17905 [Phycisphaerae bacterium]|nr:hypothetical protein [Phycisphaerae bacterium]
MLESLPHDASSETARIQVLLAKKRTSLAVLRTGISVFTLPLSVTTVLVATSRFYDFVANLHYLIALLLLCLFLSGLGFYLVARSLSAIRQQDRDLRGIVESWKSN